MRGSKSVTAFAPATVANVSCGFDCLGFALDAPGDRVEVAFREARGMEVVEITGDSGRLSKVPEENTATVPMLAMVKSLDSRGFAWPSKGFRVRVAKGLPLGSGMGSSAASAAAGAFAFNELLGRPFSGPELVAFAAEGERVACGAAHADNVAPSILGGFVLMRGSAPEDLSVLKVGAKIFCAVVHPDIEVATKEARAILPGAIARGDAVLQAANLALFVDSLSKGDLAGVSRALVDKIAEPYRAGLIPGFSDAKAGAIAAGALGAGISGSGPSMFALCPGKAIAEAAANAIARAFASNGLTSQSYVSPLGGGARLCKGF